MEPRWALVAFGLDPEAFDVLALPEDCLSIALDREGWTLIGTDSELIDVPLQSNPRRVVDDDDPA